MASPDEKNLESLLLALPDLSAGDPAVQFQVTDSTEGLLAEIGRRLVGLGQRAQHWRVVPESLGWLTLWSRALTVADANRAAWQGRSTFAAQLIWRAAFELQYHLVVISDPTRIRWPDTVQEDCPESEISANDRLCAYFAFCLNNDARYFESLTRGWLLHSLWSDDDEPADAAQAAFRKLARHILREQPGEPDSDARSLRAQSRQSSREQCDTAESWLAHPRLAQWTRAIRVINGGRGPATFYGVLNPRRDSLAQDTFKTSFAVATPAYNRISTLLHGSTIDGFMQAEDGRLAPASATPADLEREVRSNIYALLMCWLMLHALASHVDEVAR